MKKTIYIYLTIILFSSFLLSGCTQKEQEEENTVNQNQEEESKEEEKEVVDLGSLSNPEEFKKIKQSLGESSDFEYAIDSIQERNGNGYHEFIFNISSSMEGAVIPLFTVDPLLDKGIIRVTLSNIVKDNTGITHEDGITVDLGAISGIFRGITSLENTRIYDIGILANNPFKLDLDQEEVGKWSYSVKVAYEEEYVAPEIDFGSTEFSSDEQSIEGVTSSQGAKISSYSYNMVKNVLKFTFVVGSGASNPIPSVTAKYDEEGILVVTFASLESDKVTKWGDEISLPSGIKVFVSTSGESSMYRFGGISNMKPFKLSATQGPNQVLIEIQL